MTLVELFLILLHDFATIHIYIFKLLFYFCVLILLKNKE